MFYTWSGVHLSSIHLQLNQKSLLSVAPEQGLSGTFLLDRRELAFFSAGCSYSGNYEQC